VHELGEVTGLQLMENNIVVYRATSAEYWPK